MQSLVIIVVALVVFSFVLAFPLMLAARALKAPNSDFWVCLGAAIAGGICSAIVAAVTGTMDSLLGYLISLIVTAAVYSLILRTSFMQSLLIALLAVVIQIVMVYAFTALLGGALMLGGVTP